MAVSWVSEPEFMDVGRRLVMPVDTVLDIGCGIRPMNLFSPRLHLCIEPHPEYVAHLRERLRGDGRYRVFEETWFVALRRFDEQSIDSVFALDFIEHLEKADGLAFLRTAQYLARRQVVIFTPLGEYPQNFDDETLLDHDGFHGLHWQTHQSAWTPEDFEGWHVIATREFHRWDQHGEPLEAPVGAFWAVWNRP